jgi:hypothetical protein
MSKAHAVIATDGLSSELRASREISGGPPVRKIYTDVERRIAIAIGGMGILESRSLLSVVEDTLADYKDSPTAPAIAGWLGHKLRPAIARELTRIRDRAPGLSALYRSTLYVAVCAKRGPSLAQVKIEATKSSVTPFVEREVYVNPPTCLIDFFESEPLPDSESADLTGEVVRMVQAAVIAERQKHNGVNVDCGEPIQTAELRTTGVVGMIWKSSAA